MLSVYKLITKTNLKSPVIAFPLLMPIVLLFLFSINISSEEELANALVTLIALITLQAGIFGFGFTFLEMRKSVLLRRVGATKITKQEVMFAILFYGITIWLITIVWTLGFASILSVSGFFRDDNGNVLHIPWAEITWSIVGLATILSLILSFPLGLLFVSLSKNEQQFSFYASTYFFAVAFLGGMFFPNAGITWMKYTSYLIPHSYNLHMYQAGAFGVAFTDIFNWSSGYSYTFTTIDVSTGLLETVTVEVPGWEAALNFWVPIAVGGAALGGAAKMFKWD